MRRCNASTWATCSAALLAPAAGPARGLPWPARDLGGRLAGLLAALLRTRLHLLDAFVDRDRRRVDECARAVNGDRRFELADLAADLRHVCDCACAVFGILPERQPSSPAITPRSEPSTIFGKIALHEHDDRIAAELLRPLLRRFVSLDEEPVIDSTPVSA